MRRHELDWVSLVAGAVFLTIGLGALLEAATDVAVDGRWLVPLALLAFGAVGLASALRGSSTAREDGDADAAAL